MRERGSRDVGYHRHSGICDLGLEIFPREQRTPRALAAFHKAEIETWWPIFKAAGIKAD
jgi:hypothetical protein